MSEPKELAALFRRTLERHRASRRRGGKGLGRMARLAADPALGDALRLARTASRQERGRIDAVFVAMGRKPRGRLCAVTEEHLDAAKAMLTDLTGGAALDAGLAAIAAALDGLAAGRLLLLRAWAGQLGLAEALPHLDSLRIEAGRSCERFAALVENGTRPPSGPGGPALTPKQAALIGLR